MSFVVDKLSKALEWRKQVIEYIENCEEIKEIESDTRPPV